MLIISSVKFTENCTRESLFYVKG